MQRQLSATCTLDYGLIHFNYIVISAIGPQYGWHTIWAWSESWCFRDLDAPFPARAPGDHHDALPLTNLIDRPGIGFALVIGVGILAGSREVDGFRESLIQDFVEEALDCHALAFQRHVGEQLADFLRALKSDRFHWRADSSVSVMA